MSLIKAHESSQVRGLLDMHVQTHMHTNKKGQTKIASSFKAGSCLQRIVPRMQTCMRKNHKLAGGKNDFVIANSSIES